MATVDPGDVAAGPLDRSGAPEGVPEGFDPVVYRRRWAILVVLCLSLVMVVVANTALNVALPTLVKSLHASETQLQWITDAYGLVFAGLLLPAGALGDRFGRKGALQLGLTIVGIGCLASTFATDANQLIGTRAFMGAGAAFVMPATLSILANVFPPGERARAIAIWAGFAGAGGAIGPIVSGLLLDHFWWGSVFFVNVPVVIVALISGAILVPTSRDPNHVRLDPVGAVLSVTSLAALLYAIIEAPLNGWGSPATVAGFVICVAAGVSFVLWERHSDHPMLPMSFFSNRRFSVGAGTITLNFFCMFGLFFVFTQYLQFVRGYSPLQAGLATLPLAVMLIVFAPRSAKAVARFGQARVQATGLCFTAIGLLVISTVGPTTSYWSIALGLSLMGFGVAFTTAPATNAIVSSVPLAKSGVGSAVNDTTREVGGALGIAVMGSLVTSLYQSTVHTKLSHLPAGLFDQVHVGIGQALAVAHALPGPAGHRLAATASSAYTDAMGISLILAAVVALGAAAMVLVFFPRGEDAPVVEPAAGEAVADQAVADGPPPLAPDEVHSP
jgi:EmrB/QacA subfamily drug resistance transporter